MEEFDDKKRILLKNKSYILRMPNNKKKVDLLNGYFSLLGFCQLLNMKTIVDESTYIDDEFTKKYTKYLINDTQKMISEIELNAKKLYDIYQQITDTYKENDFCEYEKLMHIKVNKNKMIQALWDFFSFLGEDVLKIFQNMQLEDNIFLNSYPMERLGYAANGTPLDNACIVVQNIPNYLAFYTTLAHEIGHCYQFYLQKTSRNYSNFDPYCEITSMLFGRLFILYLKDNYVIKDDLMLDLENNISFLNTVSVSKAVCKLLVDKKIGVINPYDLSYTCSVSKDIIESEIINDCGYINPIITDPEFTEINYSFGDIIASYFIERLNNDFKTGWNEFKNFICTVNYLPMSEVIDEYFDLNLVKGDIKKLIKSYRER